MKVIKAKGLMVFLLVGVMMVSMLSGCQKATEVSDATTKTEQEKEVKVAESTEATEVIKPDPETVIWYISGTEQEQQDVVIEELNKMLVEKANILLDFRVIPDGEYNDRMKLIAMSGDEYDLCFTSSWKNKFDENVARNGFMPIDDIINEYGKEMKELLPEGVFNAGKMNGVSYAVANYQFDCIQGAFYIRKDLSDKYGWDYSKIKEFKDIEFILKDIKDNEDVIPFFTTQELYFYENYEPLINLGLPLGDDSLKFVDVYSTDEHEAQANLWRDWYKKGYFQEDIATADFETLRKTGQYGVIFHTWNPTGETNTKQIYGEEYVPLRVGEPSLVANFGAATMTGVNVNSKQPEAAVKLMNLMNSDPEVYNLLVYGIEGQHYTMVDGKVDQIEDSGYDMLYRAWMVGNSFLRYDRVEDLENWKDLSLSIMDGANKSPAMGFSFDSSSYQTELAQLASIQTEFKYAPFLMDADEWLEQYREKRDKAGIKTYLEGAQKALDEWKASVGK